MQNFMVVTGLCWVLAGCGSLSQPASVAFDQVHKVSLSRAQNLVVEAGVREIVASHEPESASRARFGSFTAFRIGADPQVNVCGDVSYKKAASRGVTVPFFLELIDKNGAPFAKRGQIGYDKLKKAKVVYLCKKVDRVS